MSGQAHAEFEHYASLSATLSDDRRIIHSIGPCRDLLWDNISLWLAARQFMAVLACVLSVHARLDQADLLAAGERVVAAEERLNAEMEAEMANRPGARPAAGA